MRTDEHTATAGDDRGNTHVLTTDVDSHTLLEPITDRVRRSLAAAWCVVLVRATDSTSLEILGESVAPDFQPDRDLVHRRPVTLSALTGAVIMIDDFEITTPRSASFTEAAALSDLGACRIFPLRLAGQPLGTLAVSHSTRGTRTPEAAHTDRR